MKTKKTATQENTTLLFKPDLKFMDFWHVTNDYLNTTSLGKETKSEIMIRIHDFSLQLNHTIGLYPTGNKKASGKTYDDIAAGLKETLRRAKISLARNQTYGKVFIAYWKYLCDVLKQDALLLKDEKLQDILSDFEQNISTMK
jgi:hypothetical protein